MTVKEIDAEELDRMFDNGEDISEYVDWDHATLRSPNKGEVHRVHEVQRVNVDFPFWMVEELNQEADRLNVNRQAVIKMIIDEGLRARRNRTA